MSAIKDRVKGRAVVKEGRCCNLTQQKIKKTTDRDVNLAIDLQVAKHLAYLVLLQVRADYHYEVKKGKGRTECWVEKQKVRSWIDNTDNDDLSIRFWLRVMQQEDSNRNVDKVLRFIKEKPTHPQTFSIFNSF